MNNVAIGNKQRRNQRRRSRRSPAKRALSAACGPGRLVHKRCRRGHAACGNILAFSFFLLLFIYCYLRPWTNDRGGRLAVRRGCLAPWLRPCPCLGPLAYNYSQSSLKASIGIFLMSRAVNSNSRPFLIVSWLKVLFTDLL